ncbi:MAG: hypothetical protein A2V67_00445 [Deltaproteobacteria bacterium RBG_13_61_14]|nr:MAG: hypothetical protein A2V67_00445 [Deltaproteobacteria bacterium RBG_13_61_14]
MIEFKLTDDQQRLVEQAHQFAKNVLRPAEIELDKIADPEEVFKSGLFRDVMRQAYKMGYHRMLLPAHVGGLGLDPVTITLINEELFWGGPGLTQNIMVGVFVAFTAMMTNKASLRKEFIEPYCADTEATQMGCFAGVEPLVGSDLIWVSDPTVRCRVSARKVGDEYIINGAKSAFISSGGIANMIGVAACVEPDRGMRGTGLFIVPGDLKGISRGKALNKLGLRCLNQTEVFFDEVKVPKRYLAIRPREDNWLNFVKSFICFGNTGVAVTGLALMRAAYEEAFVYAQERVQGGKPIIEHHNIGMKLFDAYQTIEAARALIWKVSWKNGHQFPGDIPLTAAARCFTTNNATRVTAEMVQVLGAYGITKEYHLEKYYRDAKLTQIEDGAVDTMAVAGLTLLYEPEFGQERWEQERRAK